MLTHVSSTEAGDQCQTSLLVLWVELSHQRLEVIRRHARAGFQTNWVLNTTGKLDMRTIWLACAVADPDHVARASKPLTCRAVHTRERLFVLQKQGFMAGVELDGLQSVRGISIDARRRHKVERVRDASCDLPVLLDLFAFRKAQRPGMYLMDIRIAAC